MVLVLAILSVEKFVQHMVVTVAFLVNNDGIRSSVAVDYRVLMITGFIVGVLFAVNIPFLLKQRVNSFRLLLGLAVFDVIGEFIAQGTFAIKVVVSFIVAWAIILLVAAHWTRESIVLSRIT